MYKKRYTEKVRLAILELAQRICPIDESVINELRETQKTGKKSLFSFLKKKDTIETEIEENTNKNSELDYDVDSIGLNEALQNIKSEEAVSHEARE